jgi:hypothetical protein
MYSAYHSTPTHLPHQSTDTFLPTQKNWFFQWLWTQWITRQWNTNQKKCKICWSTIMAGENKKLLFNKMQLVETMTSNVYSSRYILTVMKRCMRHMVQAYGHVIVYYHVVRRYYHHPAFLFQRMYFFYYQCLLLCRVAGTPAVLMQFKSPLLWNILHKLHSVHIMC